jgi:hypothetical protein
MKHLGDDYCQAKPLRPSLLPPAPPGGELLAYRKTPGFRLSCLASFVLHRCANTIFLYSLFPQSQASQKRWNQDSSIKGVRFIKIKSCSIIYGYIYRRWYRTPTHQSTRSPSKLNKRTSQTAILRRSIEWKQNGATASYLLTKWKPKWGPYRRKWERDFGTAASARLLHRCSPCRKARLRWDGCSHKTKPLLQPTAKWDSDETAAPETAVEPTAK